MAIKNEDKILKYNGLKTLVKNICDNFARISHKHTKSDITDFPTSMPASDVYSWAKQQNKPTYTKSEVGLGNVENKSSATIRGEITKTNVISALGYTPYTPNEVDNKLSALETNIDWKESVATYDDIATTYPNPDHGWTVNVKDTDYTYRYNGTSWIAISANAIPKATNTVDGLLSKEDHVRYDSAKTHADSAHARTDATKVEKSTTNGNIKINGTETNVYTHPSGTNPHGTTKRDLGLENVDNTADANKSVKYATSAGSANSATTASKATSVADYGNTENSIQIGFDGAGATTSNLGYIAGYLTGGKQIKDVSKDVLTSWLGLGSLAYSSATIPTTLPANGGNASTVNGHTVNSDVPANAKFTDTDTWRPQPDWNATSGEAAIKNKPSTFPPSSHTHTKSQISDFPPSLPASDVSAWAKASSKPSYTANEVGAVPTSGGSVNGAITFGKSDEYGLRTSTDNYGRIGDATKQFYEVYANTLYEDKTKLAEKYAAKSHTHSNYLTGGSQTSTSSADGGSNVYTFSDGSTITVKNGSKGSAGAPGTPGKDGVTPTIKVASGSSIGSVGTPSVVANTSGTTTTFTFNYLKGAKGEKGDPGVNATTTAVATTSANGLMSSRDKTNHDTMYRALSDEITESMVNSLF